MQMDKEVVKALAGKACASIRYRTRKEILEEKPDINEYLDEILDDKRVKYVFSWQKPDGYLGQSFHGGWIPDAKLKFYNTGAETAIRFLSEMGVPKNYPAVEKGLNALLREGWFFDGIGRFEYQPEIGLFGVDNIRAVVFAYYGIEEHEFIRTEIKRLLGYIARMQEISSIQDITGTYRNKLYFNKGIPLPDIYNLKLLAFTQSWRNNHNITAVIKALEHLIHMSPLPVIHIKIGTQLCAPARIFPRDLKKSLKDFGPKDWFFWMHTMELFARMGVVKKIPALLRQANDLKEMMDENGGIFPFKPDPGFFVKWSCYTGLALEDSWAKERWKYDLTFRSLLILKYAVML
jgi:DNA-binding phage protein